jgi:hypothetical protein
MNEDLEAWPNGVREKQKNEWMTAFAPEQIGACDGVAATIGARKESVKRKEIKKIAWQPRCTKSGGNLVVRGLSGELGGSGTSPCSLCRWSRHGKNVGSSTGSPEEEDQGIVFTKGMWSFFVAIGRSGERENQIRKMESFWTWATLQRWPDNEVDTLGGD